jgi:hypothetical protein
MGPDATAMAEQIWVAPPHPPAESLPGASAESASLGAVDAEEVFRKFKEGIAREIPAGDAQSHADLAMAYGEMGLMADAFREAAIALRETAPRPIVCRVLAWMFDPAHARPEAVAVLRAMMSVSTH